LLPLVAVHAASHALEPIDHVGFGTFFKGRRRKTLRRGRDDRLCASALDRVNPLVHQRACCAGPASSSDEAHVNERAEPHVARATIQTVTVDPRSRAAWSDL
jgi:hypothetical protein